MSKRLGLSAFFLVLLALQSCAGSDADVSGGTGAADVFIGGAGVSRLQALLEGTTATDSEIISAAMQATNDFRNAGGRLADVLTQADLDQQSAAYNRQIQNREASLGGYVAYAPSSPPRPIQCYGRPGKLAIAFSDDYFPAVYDYRSPPPGGSYRAGVCLRGFAVKTTINSAESIHLLTYALIQPGVVSPSCVNLVSPVGEYERCIDFERVTEPLRNLARRWKEEIQRGLSQNLNMAPHVAAVVAVLIVAILLTGTVALAI